MTDPTFGKRAQRAAAPSQLDELAAQLSDPSAAARRTASGESLAQLRQKLSFDDHWGSQMAQQKLESMKCRQQQQRMQLKADGKWELLIARYERYIVLQEQQEQQAWQQQQQAGANASAQEEPLDRSKQWLKAALRNSAATEEPSQHPTAAGGSAAAPPRQHFQSGTRDYDGLNYDNDSTDLTNNAPQAHRGAPQQQARHNKLLAVSSNGRQKQVPQQQGGGGHRKQHAQQSERLQPLADKCGFCFERAPPGNAKFLKRNKYKQGGEVVDVCWDCSEKNKDLLTPMVTGKRQTTMAEIMPRQQQQQQGAWQQARRPQLELASTGTFLLQTAQQATFKGGSGSGGGGGGAAGGGSKAAAGGGNKAAAGGGRQPSRGKGAGPRRGDADEEWQPAADGQLQQQQGGRQQAAAAASEDDSELEWDPARRTGPQRQRRPSLRQRGAVQQDTNAEPVCIDLLSDEDGGPSPPAADASGGSGDAGPARAAAGAMGMAAGIRSRAARARAYRSTADRFKGLKCLYPPEGGPGAVEVTHLDLPRLDPDEFLNDSVIDFYIRWMQDQLPPEVADRCYFFNTFFFKKLTEDSGGALTPELEAWAKQNSVVGQKLQALRNHQKVKKWTKDVDLFAKDYIFVPVHEALHWSLMVICHPGVVAQPQQQQQSRKGEGSGAAPASQPPASAAGGKVAPGQKTACILHLDSLQGSHRGLPMANQLRLYLSNEWHIKSLTGAPDSVPKQWVAAHPGETRSWMPNAFPYRQPKVPRQDNHCDCGLFVCSYTEFFTHKLPAVISYPDLDHLKDYGRTNRDLFEGTDNCYPGLLTDQWFMGRNPSNLRSEIRRLVLGFMADQGGLRVPGTDVWKEGDELAEEVKHELVQLRAKLARDKYVRPGEWERMAEVRKLERRAALAKRQSEAADKADQRKRRQSGAAKAVRGTPDRETLAWAAEVRGNAAGGGAGGGDKCGGGGGALDRRNAAEHLFDGIGDVAAQRDSDEGDDLELQHLPSARKRLRLRQHGQRQQAGGGGGDGEGAAQGMLGSQPDSSEFAVVLEGSPAASADLDEEEDSPAASVDRQPTHNSTAEDIVDGMAGSLLGREIQDAELEQERQQQQLEQEMDEEDWRYWNRRQRRGMRLGRLVDYSDDDDESEEEEDAPDPEPGGGGGGGGNGQLASPPRGQQQQQQQQQGGQQQVEGTPPSSKRRRTQQQQQQQASPSEVNLLASPSEARSGGSRGGARGGSARHGGGQGGSKSGAGLQAGGGGGGDDDDVADQGWDDEDLDIVVDDEQQQQQQQRHHHHKREQPAGDAAAAAAGPADGGEGRKVKGPRSPSAPKRHKAGGQQQQRLADAVAMPLPAAGAAASGGASGGVEVARGVSAEDGAECEVDWGRVAHVAGVLLGRGDGQGGGGELPTDQQTAELRFFYRDDTNHTVRVPFPAATAAASVQAAAQWRLHHRQQLESLSQNFEQFEACHTSNTEGKRGIQPVQAAEEQPRERAAEQQQQQASHQQQDASVPGNGRATTTVGVTGGGDGGARATAAAGSMPPLLLDHAAAPAVVAFPFPQQDKQQDEQEVDDEEQQQQEEEEEQQEQEEEEEQQQQYTQEQTDEDEVLEIDDTPISQEQQQLDWQQQLEWQQQQPPEGPPPLLEQPHRQAGGGGSGGGSSEAWQDATSNPLSTAGVPAVAAAAADTASHPEELPAETSIRQGLAGMCLQAAAAAAAAPAATAAAVALAAAARALTPAQLQRQQHEQRQERLQHAAAAAAAAAFYEVQDVTVEDEEEAPAQYQQQQQQPGSTAAVPAAGTSSGDRQPLHQQQQPVQGAHQQRQPQPGRGRRKIIPPMQKPVDGLPPPPQLAEGQPLPPAERPHLQQQQAGWNPHLIGTCSQAAQAGPPGPGTGQQQQQALMPHQQQEAPPGELPAVSPTRQLQRQRHQQRPKQHLYQPTSPCQVSPGSVSLRMMRCAGPKPADQEQQHGHGGAGGGSSGVAAAAEAEPLAGLGQPAAHDERYADKAYQQQQQQRASPRLTPLRSAAQAAATAAADAAEQAAVENLTQQQQHQQQQQQQQSPLKVADVQVALVFQQQQQQQQAAANLGATVAQIGKSMDAQKRQVAARRSEAASRQQKRQRDPPASSHLAAACSEPVDLISDAE